jgi:transglutaminase-like putative cysteine protease
LSLNSVLSGNGWLGAGIGAVTVVAAAGTATRLFGWPLVITTTLLPLIAVSNLLAWWQWPVFIALLLLAVAGAARLPMLRCATVAAGYASALLIYFSAIFTSGVSVLGLVPSRESLRVLSLMLRQGLADLHSAEPPVTDFRAVSLVTATGIGLIAIAVDLLAVRFRRAGVAGVPLLLLFCAPLASNLRKVGGGEPIIFAAAFISYLALLAVVWREDLRRWGPPVTFQYALSAHTEGGHATDTSGLRASGRRIGLAAVCLATVFSAILPTGYAFGLFKTTLGSPGPDSEVFELQPLLQVQQELSLGKPKPVLTYTTAGPERSGEYLQVYVLNFYPKQDNWLPSIPGPERATGSGQLPWPAPGVAVNTPVTRVQLRVHISKDDDGPAILPIPYFPTRLVASGSGWREARDTLTVSGTEGLPGLRYSVTSEIVTTTQIRSQGTVPASVRAQYGVYNGPDASQLLTIAKDHTKGATNPIQQARDLQDWFQSGAFTYSLKTNLPATNWLLSFLTTDKRGACRQYAWAFAVLARTLGIPSRVAVGYTGGTYAGHGTWTVSTADAHAWPELYFPASGWLRFEPTPVSGGQGTATLPAYASGPGSSSMPSSVPNRERPAYATPASTGESKVPPRKHPVSVPSPGESPGAVMPSGAGTGSGTAALLTLAVLLLLASPFIARRLTRRWRWTGARDDAAIAHAAWRELTDTLADFGMAAHPGETPRTFTGRVAELTTLRGPAADAIARITRAEERASYAPQPLPSAGLRSDVAIARRAIAAATSRNNRFRAELLPSSTLAAAGVHAQLAAEWASTVASGWRVARCKRSTSQQRQGSTLR